MGRKKLTPEDIKIYVDSIYSFLEKEKPLSEIVKFNSRFRILKTILLKKKIISLRLEKNKKDRYIHYFKANPSFVIFPKDYEDILNVYQKIIKNQNEKFADNIEMRFIKKQEAKEDVKSLEPEFHPVIENLKKEIYFQNQQIKSLKNQDEFSKEKIDKLQKENKKYITEYSVFINDKLNYIEQLKQELYQQKSQKNQISIIKIFGIPFIKKTTKTIK
jgi:hypothetical protein